jgi:hypothetical protein
MPSLSAKDVLRGDILICKSFALGMTLTHALIRSGQFLSGSPIRSNSVHAAIAVSDGSVPVRVIESTGEGVNAATCDVEADVFRLKSSRKLAGQAADVAERLKTWTERHKTSGGRPAGHDNNKWRAMFSVARSESYDQKAK